MAWIVSIVVHMHVRSPLDLNLCACACSALQDSAGATAGAANAVGGGPEARSWGGFGVAFMLTAFDDTWLIMITSTTTITITSYCCASAMSTCVITTFDHSQFVKGVSFVHLINCQDCN